MIRFTLALLLPAIAHAAPIDLRVQGRLIDVNGEPVNGTHDVEVRIWDDGSSWSSAAFSESFANVSFSGGYYALTLGAGSTELSHTAIDGANAVFALALDGGAPFTAEALGTVPHAAWTTALRASDSAPVACEAGDEGALYFDTTLMAVQVCHGADGWQSLGSGGPGTTPSQAVASCVDLRNTSPSAGDGTYWIDTDGNGPEQPFQAYCLMSVDGGGWTLVSEGFPVSNSALNLCTTNAVGTLTHSDELVAGPAKLSNDTINAIWSDGTTKELLFASDEGNSSGTAVTWDRVCRMNFRSSYTFQSVGVHGALSDLDSTTVSCSTGASWTIANGYTNGNYCGYYYSSSGASTYAIWGASTGYSGGSCTGNAGRSWHGTPGNYGCNTTKVYVR